MSPYRVIPTQQISVSASPTSQNPGLSSFVTDASGNTIVMRHPVPNTWEELALLLGSTMLDALIQQAPEFVSPRAKWMLSYSVNLAIAPLESPEQTPGNDIGDDFSRTSPECTSFATETTPGEDFEHTSWLRSLRPRR